MTPCTVRDCHRPAKWQLVTTDLTLAACPVHLDSLTTHVTDRTGQAPVQRSIRQEPAVNTPHWQLTPTEVREVIGEADTAPTLTGPAPELRRDRYGRPLVVPPGGGKPVPYMRATTLAGTLEDTWNLGRWQTRMTALGLAQRPDLMLAVSAHHGDKEQLNSICEAAQEAAKASAAATTGTALHALCERLDRGLPLGVVPAAYQPDLDAYQKATAGLTHERIEEFTVVDGLQVGGTPDRISRLDDGRLVIADLKTGSIEWGMGKICMQLALYAHAEAYDIVTGKRSPLGPVDRKVALIIHLPAGQGKCELVEVDIRAGWQAVALACQVREWRKRRDLARPVTTAVTLAALIATTTTVADLEALWATRHDEFTDDDIQRAIEQKARLTGSGDTAA